MTQSLKSSFSGAIRPVCSADLEAIVAVDNSCFGPEESYPRELLQDFLQASGKSSGTIMLIASDSGAGDVAGYALGTVDKKSGAGLIISLAVTAPYQGQGLGRKLLEQVSESLQSCGANKLFLQVEVDNASAIHLYETSGFVKTALLRHYYNGRDGMEMTKYLGKKIPKNGARPQNVLPITER